MRASAMRRSASEEADCAAAVCASSCDSVSFKSSFSTSAQAPSAIAATIATPATITHPTERLCPSRCGGKCCALGEACSIGVESVVMETSGDWWDGRAAPRRIGRGRARWALPREGNRDKPPSRDPGEVAVLLARLGRADEERQLLLRPARGKIRVAVEDQDGGAVVPGELFRWDAELVVRDRGHVDARAFDVDAAGAPDAYLHREAVRLLVDRSRQHVERLDLEPRGRRDVSDRGGLRALVGRTAVGAGRQGRGAAL